MLLYMQGFMSATLVKFIQGKKKKHNVSFSTESSTIKGNNGKKLKSEGVNDLFINASDDFINLLSMPKPIEGSENSAKYNMCCLVKRILVYFYMKFGIRRANSFVVFKAYKLMHPIFIGSHAHNYALETFRLFLRVYYDLSEYDAFIIFHNRYCNEAGRSNRSIPWDLR